MPEEFDNQSSMDGFWHPFRMQFIFIRYPVVFAALRPPATFCHPFGMQRSSRFIVLSP